MKIIKRGVAPSERVYRCTCGHCNSVLEFLLDEGRITRDQRDGDYVSVDCPVCLATVRTDLDNYNR